MKTTSISNETNLGTMRYPFLSQFERWTIETCTIKTAEELEALANDARTPTLMWVGDGKANRLFIPACTTEQFWTKTGLRPSLAKGGYTLSKRLKRVLSPERFWTFLPKDEVAIRHDETLNAALWDGCGQVSAAFVERFLETLSLSKREARMLRHCGRFEITVMHDGGQEKGHVVVVEGLNADFVFPAGSAKAQLRLTGESVYVALNPVHQHNEMLLDIQSLINLHPFFSNGQLGAWHREWLQTFAVGIREGRQTALMMKRLAHIDSAADLEKTEQWHVLDYLASGGHPMWFAGIVKALGNQVAKMLGYKLNKFRFPIPGGRYYIMPAVVGHKQVGRGEIELDPRHATAWVNDADWLTYIVDTLGGCDGDDALWCHPFTDREDGEQKVLVWRSPNQLGEYVLLRPTARCHAIGWETADGVTHYWVAGDSSKLPPRIDQIEVAYGELKAEAGQPALPYSVEAMWPTVLQGHKNANTLGGFCNLLMVVKAVYGRLPKWMPASMEDVIDGMVKEGRDLSPVKDWLGETALTLAQRETAVPAALMERLLPLLGSDQAARRRVRIARHHWLDVLVQSGKIALESFMAEIEGLAFAACPPVGLFRAYEGWIHDGKRVKEAYAAAIRQAPKGEGGEVPEEAFARALAATEAVLSRYPSADRSNLLIGTALYCYSLGFNKETQPYAGDQVVWQLGSREDETATRAPGIAQSFIAALRQTGLLTTQLWAGDGVSVQARERQLDHMGVIVRLNGVWINYLNAGRLAAQQPPYTKMKEVAADVRRATKQKIDRLAQTDLRGAQLELVVEESRTVAYTALGNKFGMVDKWDSVAPGAYRLAWSLAEDGNVYTILQTRA